ncbi:MAG: Na+/H+ antiporter NhaA [Gammaproteobacteria bacterium]|nr:Na+/H+ antiporter NhaA [Gammaproteobacteria bacterium]NDB15688.1 Na+/H+ antiporter NhaA [Gammaproteobacteria bacterium]NDE87204.1 Na+/H+ antiporter NhaA [Gammaproteobacteria bacterium]
MEGLRKFLKSDVGAGALLVLAAAVAMTLANSAAADSYEGTLGTVLRIGIGDLALEKTVLHWINDGLMAVFFMLVGLEIKRELLDGELSDPRRAALPLFGAIGGMLVPAAVYAFVNRDSAETLVGWPIPAATDIAFAIGVLSLVKRHVAPGLRIFLLGLAIIDDLGAIVLIALLFTADISSQALTLAALCIAVLALLNRLGVERLWPYLAIGTLLWLSVLKSGVHATLAGVVIGSMIPHKAMPKLEHALHPWVTFGIMPIFALANAGASLEGVGLHTFAEPVALGIVLGLFIGKQLGVFVACGLAVRFGFAQLPAGSNWTSLHGVAILTGIGFTMSLFVGSLAFPTGEHDTAVRLGVLTGSVLSAIIGCSWLWLLRKR